LVKSQTEWVERLILTEQSNIHCPFKSETANRKTLPWTGSPTELAELLYALHEAGYFGTTPLNVLFPVASELFDCEVKYYYHLLGNIRKRVKGERTAFIDKLKKALIRKMEEDDEKPSRK
jgi:hypothetical protein